LERNNMPKSITEDDIDIIEGWYNEARKVTLASLPDFIRSVMNDYNHDYGTICKAIGACCVAAGYAANREPQAGITGFQSGAVMWEFIQHWGGYDNSVGMKLLDYSDMIYPQMQSKYEKTLRQRTVDLLKIKAQKQLDKWGGEEATVAPSVLAHVRFIAQGGIPFGYTVSED
jgi:hypothetical protein